jgi:hypothetical protein
MKRKIACLVLLLVLCISSAGADCLLSVSCDPFLGVRLGVESRFRPNMGLRVDAGAAFYGVLLADAFYLFYLLPEDHRFRLNLLIGIPTASTPITFEGAMVSLGISLAAGYRFTDIFSMDLRLGAGFPIFFERGKEVIRSVYLWPDIVLSANFILPKRS